MLCRLEYKRPQMTRSTTRSALLIPAALIGALAIAACGGSSTKAHSGSGVSAHLVSYSRCMRSHGVSSFPDPSTTETPNSFGVDGYNFDLPNGMNTQSPNYKSADLACQKWIGFGTGSGHAMSAKQRQALLAHAECMRTHGVPNFPDPKITTINGGTAVSSGGPGINPQSPAFQQAQKECQKLPG